MFVPADGNAQTTGGAIANGRYLVEVPAGATCRANNLEGKHATSENGAAIGAAVQTTAEQIDVDLARIIERWPDLPAAVQAGIRAMIDANA